MSDGKYSRIIHKYLICTFSQKNVKKNYFSWLLNIFHLKNLPGKQSYSEIYAYSLYIFTIRIRYLWILWKIFVNRNYICQINIFANRNNIHEMKLLRIRIGIFLSPKYQQIDSWQIYSRPIHEFLRIKTCSLNTGSHDWITLFIVLQLQLLTIIQEKNISCHDTFNQIMKY